MDVTANIDTRLHVYYVLVPANGTESGVDNPFRPDGELSKEADTIVSLIKEGKPITPVKGETEQEEEVTSAQVSATELDGELKVQPVSLATVNAVQSEKIGANGSAPKEHNSPSQPGVVEVQHGVVAPTAESGQAEQVMINKKPKCGCCVVQ